jgi:hypothetical protein
MPVFSSVTTAKGVTSLPVPLVVGMATNLASLPRSGMALMRLRMSCKQQHIHTVSSSLPSRDSSIGPGCEQHTTG